MLHAEHYCTIGVHAPVDGEDVVISHYDPGSRAYAGWWQAMCAPSRVWFTWGKRAQESISRGAGDALLYSLKQAIVIYFQNTMPPQNRKLNKPKLSQLRGQNASVMVFVAWISV